jgi:hypothetical protein
VSSSFESKSFNGKPQALQADFACAFGSPLNENDQYTTKSTRRQRPANWSTSSAQQTSLPSNTDIIQVIQ